MSKELGQVYLAPEKRPQFLEAAGGSMVEYSQSTAELIDKEIKNIISEQYKRALDIIRGKEDALRSVSQVLLEKEKIDGDELKELLGFDNGKQEDSES
jgi:cell division protease FtsH